MPKGVTTDKVNKVIAKQDSDYLKGKKKKTMQNATQKKYIGFKHLKPSGG